MLNDVAFGIIIGLIFVAIILLFCIILVKLYIQKIKNYTKVIYQKDIDFQKALNNTILETQEQVLNNISRDLHDDAGQQLTYINFQLENLKLDSPEMLAILEPLSQSVANLSGSIRNISHSLNNQLLTKQDLLKAMEAETERLQKNGRIKINFAVDNAAGKIFSTNEKIVIYRIFQETINNIFKHSGAIVIDIEIKTQPIFEMTIIDNGVGFDARKNDKLTLGLQNIKNRAEIINYNVDIKSVPNMGTIIVLSERIIL